jgi:hypothetical protein
MNIKLKQCRIFILITTGAIVLSLLNTGNCIAADKTGQIRIRFSQVINEKPVRFDTMIYINKAGNMFEISQIQYFISEVTLHKSGGGSYLLSPEATWHYVDNDIPASLIWNISDKITIGSYDSVSFIFGLSKENNKSYKFKNAPESLMFWPDVLGGGYHYMKINIRYLNNSGEISNFNCHIGTGQIKSSDGIIEGFIQNFFLVTLPWSSFKITGDETKTIEIVMNVEKWFALPNIIDFNNYGGIMDNEEAMKKICENGANVFNVKITD